MNIISMPIRRGDSPVGVLIAERPQDKPFDLEQLEAMRLTCDLSTARLVNLHASDRWFGARAAGAMRKALATAVGPKHTWAKVAAMAVFCFIVFMFVAQGDYRAEASFVLEAQQQQVVPAPFDGYIEAVYFEPGDPVLAGHTILARLETTKLETQRKQAQAAYTKAQKEATKAMNEGKIAEAQIARAEADKARAEIDELNRQINEASITSPMTGTIVSPDLKRKIRGHVELGEAMFEVAPIESLRAELSVPEDQIADVLVAFDVAEAEGRELTGELATEGRPDRRLAFVVERIYPVAEIEETENVFKVRVRFQEASKGLRPGMAGVAKIHIGRRSYAFLWTRKLVNWVRMKLWI